MRPLAIAFCVSALALTGTREAEAQFSGATSSLTTPPASLVAPGEVYSISLDPAALAFTPGAELLYLHADAPQAADELRTGDGVFLGGAFPMGVGLGFSVERIEADGFVSEDSGRLSFALAYVPDRRVAIGTAIRWLAAPGDPIDGATTVDLSISARPTERFGFALIAHDLFAPLGLVGRSSATLPARFLAAGAIRPLGDDRMTFEGAFGVDSDARMALRGFGSVAIPRAGHLSALVEVEDLGGANVYRIVAGADLAWGPVAVAGGVIGADGFDAGTGWYRAARVGMAWRRGLPTPGYIQDLEVRGEVGRRRILALVASLDRARDDARVAGVFLRLRGTDLGLAYAQELREVIGGLRAAGKKVVCHLDAASGAEIYACSAADLVLLDPAGTVELMGPSMDVVMLGGLLDEVGLRADFVRIGRWKSAPEQLSEERMSAAMRQEREAFLTDVYFRLVQDLSADLDRDPDSIRRLVDEGPYLAEQALAAGLVGEAADERVVEAPLARVFGRGSHRRRAPPRAMARGFSVPRHVGVVVIDGSIVDGENVDIPLVDIHQSGARTIVREIDRMGADPTVAAVVLRVDSPGGSALASDQIWRAVRRARRHKPVIASLGATAASGGYYVASAADEIFASPSTLTGSIGVYYGKVDAERLAERVGVSVEQLGRGRRSGAQSMWRPYTDDEREALEGLVELTYQRFLGRVAEGRGLRVEEVDAVAQGRVWSGEAAQRRGLVDRLGGFAAALDRARDLGGVADDVEVELVPGRPETLLDYLRGSSGDGTSLSSGVSLPLAWRRAANIVSTFGHSGASVPMALAPFWASAP